MEIKINLSGRTGRWHISGALKIEKNIPQMRSNTQIAENRCWKTIQ